MCESNAFLAKGDEQELLPKDVAYIKPEGGKLRLRSIFGEEKTVHNLEGTIGFTVFF